MLICEAINNIGEYFAQVSFGTFNNSIVTYDQTSITTNPGSTIYFTAWCLSKQFSEDPDFFRNTTVENWYEGFTIGDHSAIYEFHIPSSAAINTYSFYMGATFPGNSKFLRELAIKVIASPPSITSISSNHFSADDQITITGTGFGTSSSGSVHFNDLEVAPSQIVSWTVTQIKVIVPVGVQTGNLFVTNNNGVSNGKYYTVISSTGEPIVINPIPDQTIYQNETSLIAYLNNIFSDPNNQSLDFSATSTNQGVQILLDSVNVNKLYLITSANATGSSTITVTATDITNKSAKDTFVVTIIPNQQAFVIVTSPNGGESWETGSQHPINWVSNATSGTVSIELSRNGGSSWELLYNNTADDGSENWIVTDPATINAKIRVTDISGSPSDISDTVFSVLPENLAPTLTWASESGYESDGVNPDSGNTSSTFTFKVKYIDPEGDAPLEGYPRLYIKKGGVPINGSPFVMNEVVLKNTGVSEISNNNKKNPSNTVAKGIEIKDPNLMSKNKLAKNKNEGVIKLSPSQLKDNLKSPKINESPTLLDGLIYSVDITGLEAGTEYTYYFEAKDINNHLATGEATVKQNGPTVVATPPSLSNVGSDVISSSEVNLSGLVNPNGSTTSCRFNYGVNIPYENSTSFEDIGKDTSDVLVLVYINDLVPETEYHYQLEAVNIGGTSYSQDLTFTMVNPFS